MSSNEILKGQTTSDRIIEDYLNVLLSTDMEDDIDLELDSQPEDILTPGTRQKLPTFEAATHGLTDGSDYVGFEIFRCNGDTFTLGQVVKTPAQSYLLEFGGKQHVIMTKKLRSLLYDNLHKAYTGTIGNDKTFFVKLNKQLLLDNTE